MSQDSRSPFWKLQAGILLLIIRMQRQLLGVKTKGANSLISTTAILHSFALELNSIATGKGIQSENVTPTNLPVLAKLLNTIPILFVLTKTFN